MRTKVPAAVAVGLLLTLLWGFGGDNPFFAISAKDVALELPKHFPKPVYTFKDNKPDARIFVTGRRLFFDNLLSKDRSVSCASCHQRIAAFAHIDHRLSHGIYAKIGTRNVPPLQNLIWKDAYMWDGGVNSLELQPLNPITSPIEMDETMSSVLSKLRQDTVYRRLFASAYGDTLISSVRMLKALAQFTGLMISAGSHYDLYVQGKDTLSIAERQGLRLFRAKCSSCHAEPLFTDNGYHNNGLQMDTALKDKGRWAITHAAGDEQKFKTPGLRNIAMTYPYMHDGRFRNLKEVLNHYAGAAKQTDAEPLIRRIGTINEQDMADLIAFLQTLTDKHFLYDRRFADPFMN